MTLLIYGEDYDETNEPERDSLIRCGVDDCNYVALTKPDLLEHKRIMHS